MTFGVGTRITPAYAGNTDMPSSGYDKAEDHPRLRGEHMEVLYPIRHILGSPPPTRGTLLPPISFNQFIRITPAYAGNTTYTFNFLLLLKDHPRLRGEHLRPSVLCPNSPGSPPPTRGTHSRMEFFRFSGGITPAYAGNTICSSAVAGSVWDHPRLRGEHPYHR